MNHEVIFYPVKSNQEKLLCLCQIVQKSFSAGKKLLIVAPNEEAARYMDQLLWRHPEDSFLPHCISNSNSTDKVVITTRANNVNQASHLLNLCPNASVIANQFECIHELMDETTAEKLQLSQQRKTAYASLSG